ncbi:FecR domain-containing protein [Verrucomicrobia bacterium]|nr:FecR domain-containing protein [Verrucomicrobiota bacterium]
MNTKDSNDGRKQLEAFIAGELKGKAFDAFQASLKGDPELRDRYRRAMRLDARYRELAERDLPTEELGTFVPETGTMRWAGWGVAAALAIGLFVSLVDQNTPDRIESRGGAPELLPVNKIDEMPIAFLSMQSDADWEELELREDHLLGAGQLKLRSGLAQVEFLNGAMLVVEGPTEMTLIDDMNVRCSHGKLRVHVPEQAHGFTVHGPDMKVVDLGTEFGYVASKGHAEVHVFDGEVRLEAGMETRIVEAGNAMRLSGAEWGSFQFDEKAFADSRLILARSQDRLTLRQKEWVGYRDQMMKDEGLVLFYDFEERSPGGRAVLDLGQNGSPKHHGTAVGGRMAEGRWPGATAVEFKQGSDRVRLQVNETIESLTLMAWVRIDGFDRRWQSLMLSDHWDVGDVHWQISDEGELIIGIQTPGQGHGSYHSDKRILGRKDLGKWVHLAFVYDPVSGLARHFLNGRVVSEHVIKQAVPLTIGNADLGNWTLPEATGWDVRNLNGRIDEFWILSRPLTREEIRQQYERSRPEETISMARLAKG